MGSFVLFVAVALAGGSASAPPPPPPDVDWTALPPSATSRPASPDPKQRHPVQVRVVADKTAAEPGTKLRLGILLEQDPGWHTYWRTPGDIGQPTDIAWTLSGGAAALHVYPVPQRFEDSGIVSFGYEDRSFLISEVEVPKDASGRFEAKADVGWLVCQSSCIPGNTTVSTTLPVGPAQPSAQAPWFEHFSAQHPVASTSVAQINVETALMATAVHPESPYCVAIKVTPTDGSKIAVPEGGTWPLFTPIVEPAVDVFPGPTTVKATPDGGFIAVVTGDALASDPLPAKTAVGGLLQLDLGGKHVATEVMTALPWAAKDAPTTPSSSPLWQQAQEVGAIAADAPCRGAPVATVGGAGAPPTVAAVTPTAPPPADLSLLPLYLGMAFLGGLLLNIMPCVLPVLTLKVYGLVEDQELAPRDRRNAGLAYTGGVIASFWVLAAVVLVLQQSIGGVGWGFQFQYPGYVAALGAIVFAFGLSMFGVFEIPAIGADQAGTAAAREGLSGHFLTGAFATLLGTPCSAPFLGPAVGFAFALPMWALFLFFTVIGLGLAFPFLLVAAIPATARVMPQPGPWMITFKNLMGFTLIGTTVWLVDVLGSQTSPDAVTGYLAFLATVGFASWLFGHYGGLAESAGRQVAAMGAALGFTVGGWLTFVDLEAAAAPDCGPVAAKTEGLDFSAEIPWQRFSDATVAELRGKDQAMFVDFTAEWCLTCKVNENTVLATDEVRGTMQKLGVIPLRADWTKRDPEITNWLQRYGRAGVPFYVVIPKCGGDPIPLSEVITPTQVVDAMAQATAPCGGATDKAAGAP